jgi:hypothetical protein
VPRQARAGGWAIRTKRSAGCVEAGRGVREEAGFTARVNVKHGLPRGLHTVGRICDILYTSNNQNLGGVTAILADISQTLPFIGNAVDMDLKIGGAPINEETELVGEDQESQALLGGECARFRAFCFGHAGEYVWGECRDAVSVCLVSDRARGGVLRG